MIKCRRNLALLFITLLITGCTTPMAFQKDTETLTDNLKPVFLMTATLKNDYRTGYQPELTIVNVVKKEAMDQKNYLNFSADDKSKVLSDKAGNGILT